MTDFGEYVFAARMREAIKRIAKSVIEKERPRYRYGVVASVNMVAGTCQVYFDGDSSNSVTIRMGSVIPSATNQLVRVAGLTGDRFLDDVIGPVYSPAETAWTVVTTFAGTWVNFGSPRTITAYRKDAEGRVWIKGMVKSGTTGTTVFTLPPGYRPPENYQFRGYMSGNTVGFVDVNSDGTVVAGGAGSTIQVDLDGIVFYTT